MAGVDYFAEYKERMKARLKIAEKEPNSLYELFTRGNPEDAFSRVMEFRKMVNTQPLYIKEESLSNLEFSDNIILPLFLGHSLFKVLPSHQKLEQVNTESDYFCLFKQNLYTNNFSQALEIINKCMAFNAKKYLKWKLLVLYFLRQLDENFISQNSIDNWTIEAELLEVFVTNSEEKARALYSKNEYYGSLAWLHIFKVSNHPEKMHIITAILTKLLEKYSNNTEAYFIAIQLMKKMRRNYGQKLCESVFLHFKDVPDEYSVFVNINYAILLSYEDKYTISIEVLQETFNKYPQHIEILYYFGKICVKSGRLNILSFGIGALTEFVRFQMKNVNKAYLLMVQGMMKRNQIYRAVKYLMKIQCEQLSKSKQKLVQDIKSKLITEISWFQAIHTGEELPDKDHPLNSEFEMYCEAKILMKKNDLNEALKKLLNLHLRQEFELKYVLQEIKILKIIREYDYSDRCAGLIKLIKNSKVTSRQWVKSLIFYSKYLESMDCPEEAYKVLSFISKCFPKYKIPSPYFESLKNNEIFTEVNTDFMFNIRQSTQKISPRIIVENEISNISETLSSPKQRRYTTQIPKPGFSKSTRDKDVKDSNNLEAAIAPVHNIDTSSPWLFVTLSPVFLYKIGKLCAVNKIHEIDGIYALNNFFSLKENIMFKEQFIAKYDLKAKIYLFCLYKQSEQDSEASVLKAKIIISPKYSEFINNQKHSNLRNYFTS
ncbi:hypothetical protein SteCoe_20590 [Stentor coeruleus]|uniref:Uncharacterized protein n=1 Tax=Stentor coeruleus TaxID=5963 RepID=A0A1R2BRE1_9CILI|nr:hypothetical protein SteCoe_20590 [Stentor coeruleus]